MQLLALALSFLAVFGATWLLCMRASDWRTERWENTPRALLLALGPGAWLLLILVVRSHLYSGDLESDQMTIALLLGLPFGVAIYLIAAKIRPGIAGARPITLIARD
jgi:cytochrome bd-type quinol oxidase subunit 2